MPHHPENDPPTLTAIPQPQDNSSLLHHIAQTYHELIAAFERHMGMTRARWAMLSLLARTGETTQAALNQQLRIDAAAVTRQAKQLEAAGLITRRNDPQDNRFTIVALTPQGRQQIEALRHRRHQFEAIVTANLTSDEAAAIRRSLDHLRANLANLPPTSSK